MAALIKIIIFAFLYSCSGISTLEKIDRSKLYGQEFLESVSVINNFIDRKQLEDAEILLQQMDENSLTTNEISLKRYLLGRFYLGLLDTEKAIFNFELALSGTGKDNILISQSYLGLSVSYFKLGMYDRSLDNLTKLKNDLLSPVERLSSYNIGYQISKAFQNQKLYEQSLIGLVSVLGENQYKDNRYYQELSNLISAKSIDDQTSFGIDLAYRENLVLMNLSLSLAENLIYSGSSREAIKIIKVIEESQYTAVFAEELSSIKDKLTDNRKVSATKVGVILPLSGKYKRYGIEALNGIQVAYEGLLKDKKMELLIKDSRSSPIVSSFYAKELYDKERVGMILGGLSSSEAKEIYLELKNKQVPFVSLAQIFLPREIKDRFLIEFPPSLESEVAEVLKEENIQRLGRRGALIFSQDQAGKYYFDEFFRKSNDSFNLIDSVSYKAGEKDFREPVKELLNLKYRKLRDREYSLMKEYFDSDDNTSVRRVQILAPEVNFDWVFISSRSVEALQLIPSFNYYDAFNTLMIGPSVWNNKKVRALARKNRKLHFLNEPSLNRSQTFENEFISRYDKKPNLISRRAMNSVGLASQIISNIDYKDREAFLKKLNEVKELQYNGHKWQLTSNLWLKKIGIHHLSRGRSREGIRN
mgnify:CR=1 FL=1